MISSAFQHLLVAVLAFAATVEAASVGRSPFKLSLSKHVNATGSRNVLKFDQARFRYLKARSSGPGETLDAIVNEPITSQVVAYTATVGVGEPPTYRALLVDTSCGNTLIANYTPTRSSIQGTVNACSFTRTEYIATLTITPGFIIQQSIGVIATSNGLLDGILGLGPVDLTAGTVSGIPSLVPTVMDNAFTDGLIPSDSIAIAFEPTSTSPNNNGELTWGGVDNSKFTGSINYVPITTTFPSSLYWGLDLFISYGSTTILSSTAGIVDTGTALILIASNAFQQYQSLTGSTLDPSTGLLRITASQYAGLQTLNFGINGVIYSLPPNGQIWPRALNTAIGGTASDIYLIVGDIGANSGSGLDFILGMAFLQRFYIVLDSTNSQVGFAATPFTDATTN